MSVAHLSRQRMSITRMSMALPSGVRMSTTMPRVSMLRNGGLRTSTIMAEEEPWAMPHMSSMKLAAASTAATVASVAARSAAVAEAREKRDWRRQFMEAALLVLRTACCLQDADMPVLHAPST